MSVELLYFDGCPNVEGYLPHLRELITAAGRHDHVQLRRISNGADARTERFLGSPSVRVDGRDVDPTAANRTDFGMSCRVYASPDGMTGAPPDEWVLAALKVDTRDRDHSHETQPGRPQPAAVISGK